MTRVPLFLLLALSFGAPGLPQTVPGPEPNQGGEVSLESSDPAVALARLRAAAGFRVELFASECDFPIGKPVAINFDSKGRLWVATMPSYPHALPGVTPDDKLVILEDRDRDGRADRHAVFADGLYLPTGFELGDGGAYVAQQPNLAFLRDTDGDDVADERETILHGFGTEDSHHAISAFTWDAGGGLYFQEGTFHHTQVETPYGPVRVQDAAVFRYEPRTERFRVFVSYPFANPWGHIFDSYGQNFIADASDGSNYFGTAMTGRVDHPRKHARMKTFTSAVRPTCGIEFVSSRHFPESAQGNLLVNNCIGFQGIKRHRVFDDGSGFSSEELEPLLFSTDPNFRPVDLEFGPDGALYVADWWNPLIGHMQYSVRDPRRDHAHGRIWRIVAEGRPLLDPPRIDGAPLRDLLELLRAPEERTRYRTRLEIRRHGTDAVNAAVADFLARIDPGDPERERLLLESLWVKQGIDSPDAALLDRALAAGDFRVRAGATRVLRYWIDRVDGSLARLRALALDPHPRVRLEAILSLSDFRSAEAAEAALGALALPADYYIGYALGETIATLEPSWKPLVASGRPFAAENPAGQEYIVARLSSSDLARAARSGPVLAALLARHGIADDVRLGAIEESARRRGAAPLDELLDAIRRADSSEDAHAEHVAIDLGRLLVRFERSALARSRPALAALAAEGSRPATRQSAVAALVAADGGPAGVLSAALASAEALDDFLRAVPLFPSGKERNEIFPSLVPLLRELPEALEGGSPRDARQAARYVRVELPGDSRTLTLAEVEVISDGANVAPSGRATQSSVAWNGEASRATDGNTSGRFGDGGQTHTHEGERAPWWELDLLAERPVDAVVVWNRTEEGGVFAKRLDGFTLSVLDAARRPLFVREGEPAPKERVRIEVDSDPRGRIRASAMAALVRVEGKEREAIAAIAPFVRESGSRTAAVRALKTLPAAAFSREAAASVVEGVLAWVTSLPPDAAAAPDVQEGIRLATDLLAALPGSEAAPARAALSGATLAVFIVRPIPHEMLYDTKEIRVEAGKPVRIVFENGDIMPHNFVVTAPGALAVVGQAAEKMAADPDAYAKNFVPASPRVLHATKLLNPGQSETLAFTAPREPGAYPFVCTFPGHWTRMNGILRVEARLEPGAARTVPTRAGAASSPVAAARPFVKTWTIADVEPELHRVAHDRSLERGAKVFEAASCVQCHALGGRGGKGGPDLSQVRTKYTREEILREMLEPSKVLNEEFKPYVVTTTDERVVTGVLVSQDGRAIRLRPNLFEPDAIVEIERAEIVSALPSAVSMMPESLLVTFEMDEILDLIAYVESGGAAVSR